MKSMMRRTTLREIRQSFGRYFAIFAIVALGVGFFAGLKMAKPNMVATGDDYFTQLSLFDYRLLSTLGFRPEDVETVKAQADVRSAQGAISADILYVDKAGNDSVMKVHSLTEQVNGVVLLAGRLPEENDECVVDSALYDADAIGEKIVFAESNEEDDLELFTYREYEIVGVVQSSYYANFERGNTSLGTGKISGFMYIPEGGFETDYYTEIFVKFTEDFPIYSDAYETYMEEKEAEWETLCETLGFDRYSQIKAEAEEELAEAEAELAQEKADAESELEEAEQELLEAEAEIADGEAQLQAAKDELTLLEPFMSPSQMADAKATLEAEEATLADAKAEVTEGWAEYEDGKTEFEEEIGEAEQEIADAKAEIADLEEPDTYVLGRETNVGYACFESDTDIVAGIANVFPVFFFLVAALVCMTTMNRMVEEQRTQIGVLKALGYGETAIMGKYIFYAGSAALLGGVSGYAGGTWLFSKVIWAAYGMMYSMQELLFVFDIRLAIISLVAGLCCSVGVTWYTCHHELHLVAAELMRPKAPKAGKRVFLEYVPFLWKRLKFLQKVSIRNVMRYKKRFFMMIVGISGCTALLLVGFGIKDSVADIGVHQYGEIQIFDMGVSFSDVQEDTGFFAKKAEELGLSFVYTCEKSMDLVTDEGVKAVNLVVAKEKESFNEFVDLHTGEGEPLAYPDKGEAVITNRLAEDYALKVGDSIILRDDTWKEMEVKVSGIALNFVYDYVYLGEETYVEEQGELPEYKSAYVNVPETLDAHKTSAALMKGEDVTSITINADVASRFGSMLASLDYVVALIIGCAAFLAFIVLYNLTNINITERIREIATIKVLGFYRKETASYVFRENFVLTGIGGVVGLFLGVLLHRFVMSKLKVDMVAFAERIEWQSFVYSILFTFLFAVIVNVVMSVKLERINMAESLKSVD